MACPVFANICVRFHRNIFMKPYYYLFSGCLLLAACAQTPPKIEPPQAPIVETAPVKQEVDNAAPIPHVDIAPVLPNVELSNELLYEFLLTEIANQRGHKALAAEGSADLVRKTRDPRLARRAAQLALEAGDIKKSIEALRQWQAIEPDSTAVNRALASILLRSGKLDEAQLELARMLESEKANSGDIFILIFQMLSPYPDKQAAFKLVRDLALPYPKVAEARWAVAQIARLAGEQTLALSEVRQARSLRPEWDLAVSLEAQLLQKNMPKQALEILQRYLSDHQNSYEIRLQYALLLLEQKQFKQARDEYQKLARDNPENSDVEFAIALISLQLKDYQNAKLLLLQALEKGNKDPDTVRYYLGQLGEAQENEEEALANYRKIKGGEYQFSAQIRVVYLLNKRGRLDEAREYLQQIHASNNQQRVQILMIDAQLLREAKRLDEAYQILQQGLTKLPNHPDLLYETAMLADRIGKLDVFEQLLRKLIQLKPENANAYNALGYSLLERSERIPEAIELVEKALQLSPDDAAIMDSVGWGYYRIGRIDESLKLLRRAYADNPDPEIAAHLGEVLWMQGDKDDAMKIWQGSIKENPNNEPLQAVIKKFVPQ